MSHLILLPTCSSKYPITKIPFFLATRLTRLLGCLYIIYSLTGTYSCVVIWSALEVSYNAMECLDIFYSVVSYILQRPFFLPFRLYCSISAWKTSTHSFDLVFSSHMLEQPTLISFFHCFLLLRLRQSHWFCLEYFQF